MSARYCIGIDLGGTNIKAGLFDEQQNLLGKHATETQAERGFDHVFDRMVALVDQLLEKTGAERTNVIGVGLGAPGPLSFTEGIIYHAPNLPGWENIPLRDRFAAAIGLPVVLDNDANAAAFGEFQCGAAHAVENMVLLTLGTGIGGGVVLEGKVWRGQWSNAGEIGHTILVPDGRRCPCGQVGCFERYASANALVDQTQEALDTGEKSILTAWTASGKKLTAALIEDAVHQRDELASRIWEQTCRYLAIGCVNIEHNFEPEMIVLGGGLTGAGTMLLEPVRRQFAELRWRSSETRIQIALATLGNDAGIIGNAALARQEFADS